VTDPLGNKTSMGYDPIGRLEWVVAPKGNLAGADPQLWKTRLVSDEFGRVIEETDPLGNRVKTGSTQREHDPGGDRVVSDGHHR
jgi:YD repeat-containing protein